MKHTILNTILFCFIMLIASSCSHYLDVDPGLGLTEDEVFSTYKNYTSYFDYIFAWDFRSTNIYQAYPMFVNFNTRRFPFEATTDASDTGRRIRAQTEIKVCKLSQETCDDFTFGSYNNGAYNPLCLAMFKIIRIANRTIENINKLTDATAVQKADLLGQAYFVRAYAHFALCRFCGGMPYIDSSTYEDWDLPRLSNYDTYIKCANDFDKAYEYFVEAKKIRRDPLPGVSGHLTGTDLERPNGCAAKAMKARALLYAASPLSNQNGTSDWVAAADACGDALNLALQYQYSLLPLTSYSDNFYGKISTDETIWGWASNISSTSGYSTAIYSYPQNGAAGSSGICPTQNFVDKYETADGDPLNTEEDRQKAIDKGSYNEQDPYSNRDPRFELTIVHDGSKTPYVQGSINIYYDPIKKSWPRTSISGKTSAFGVKWGTNSTTGGTSTGYYCRKQWRGSYGRTDVAYYKLDPLVRLAELYLNYAEAANEAYGPNGKSSNCNLTAAEAINMIRRRVKMPDIKNEYTTNKDIFRERLQNERCVELAFEGMHYYYDIRRWKTAPKCMTQTLYGMYVTSCDVDAEHPNGRKYERMAIPDNRQCTWKDCMYYWPFPDSQANKMINFVNNAKWQ